MNTTTESMQSLAQTMLPNGGATLGDTRSASAITPAGNGVRGVDSERQRMMEAKLQVG